MTITKACTTLRTFVLCVAMFVFSSSTASTSQCYVPALENVSDLTDKYPYIFKGRVRYIERTGLLEPNGNRIATFDPIKIYKGQTASKFDVEYSFIPKSEYHYNSTHQHYVTGREYLIFAYRNENENLKTPPYCSYARHHNVSIEQLDNYFDKDIDSPIKHEVCVDRMVNYSDALRAARNDTFGKVDHERHCYGAPTNPYSSEIFTGNFELEFP
ncbi:MAG: hypothetical protein ACPGVT_09630 [Maricaulaceae bacterium]